MSAPRNTAVRLDEEAWKIFIQTGLTFPEVWGNEVWERVLTAVTTRQYSWAYLAQLIRGTDGHYSRDQYQEWIGHARTTDETLQRLIAHTFTRRLKNLLGAGPRFREWDNDRYIFLGRFRRNPDELPLTGGQEALPKEKDRVVDLWGRRDGGVVIVRGELMDDRAFEPTDELDSQAEEAFRRLACELELERLAA